MLQNHKHKRIAVPPLLQSLPNAPTRLFVIGDTLDQLLEQPRVAIVGSRQMSPYGRQVTEDIASKLAGRGVVIISGLAYGVDACAHRTALRAGGKCLVVQGNGLDALYPTANARLGEEIVAQGGVIVSEYSPGTKPRKHYFLERNRLVSGLADAVIITEAAARSGTLNTAAHALNQGKPVFAVPGNITSPLSEGTNNLIKAGAMPLTSADDVLQYLQLSAGGAQTSLPTATNQQEYIILTLIQQGIVGGDELLRQSGLDTPIFNQTLTMLEITAKIRPLGANRWAIA